MKTAVFADYKPTDALSASGFMAGLPHGCGLVSKWCLRGMIASKTSVDTSGSLSVTFCCNAY
jgi:hypothetical protein